MKKKTVVALVLALALVLAVGAAPAAARGPQGDIPANEHANLVQCPCCNVPMTAACKNSAGTFPFTAACVHACRPALSQ